MRENDYVIIMAGGIGSRFWPMSRTSFPKQFHDILGTGKSMIRMTFERFEDFIPHKNILVVTNSRYYDLVKEQLPELTDHEILLEPVGRNTAPCVAYATFKIRERNPDASILVVGADYWIPDTHNFLKDAGLGLDMSRSMASIITLGIRPSRPDTGYGYIQFIEDENGAPQPYYEVKTFTEKPPLEVAKEYLSSGDFLWNSGMFIFSVGTILDAFGRFLPDMYEIFDGIASRLDSDDEKDAVADAYARCGNVSIDYGIMEKAESVYVIPSSFQWSDLGTWGSVYEHLEQDYLGNAATGKVIAFDSAGNLVKCKDSEKLIVLHGLNDFIVVDTGDALLICKKDNEQQIKEVVAQVKKDYGDEFA